MSKLRIVIAVVFIAFLIGMYFIVTAYFNQVDRVNASNNQIEELRGEIEAVKKDYDNFPGINEDELLELEHDLVTASKLVPVQNDVFANDVIRAILLLGDKNNVSVIPLVNKAWSSNSFGSKSYYKLTMSIEATGVWDDMIDFLDQLQSTKFYTLACEKLAITLDGDGETSTQITLSVYTQ